MALIDEVKTQLRENGTAHNTEIQALIDSAIIDLTESGVLGVTTSTTDAMIKQAIVLYCKGQYGYENPEAERFTAEYEKHKAKLATLSKYNIYSVTFTVASGLTKLRDAQIVINDDNYTVLYTNSQGVAVYYTDNGDDVDYSVSKSGYTTVTGTVYVDGNEAVAVSMT